jgi:polysaccharide deacetylase family protein (PEP-CTERM system associated)
VNHHFTVDVEEYFQVSAFESSIDRRCWNDFESRVGSSVSRLLELMARHGVRGTFFILGWIAERHRELVSRIAAEGHEIASHGWAHRRVNQLTPAEFRESVRRSKQLLEDLTGAPVLGFRAPTFSIIRGCEWALDILIEEGYGYDSSLFPVWRPGYGYANGLRDPHWIQRATGRLAEIPPTTLSFWGVNLPAAGGGYFRLLPYGLGRAAFRDCERRGVPATFYIHPWELDPDQPRLDVPFLARVRHYSGLRKTGGRLQRLLSEFSFQPIVDTVAIL